MTSIHPPPEQMSDDIGPRKESMHLRILPGETASELFLCATPTPEGDASRQWRGLYQAIAAALAQHEGHILQERCFATPPAFPTLPAARSTCLGTRDDGVKPSRVCVAASEAGPVAGVLVHAVCGVEPAVVDPHTRWVPLSTGRYLACSGLTGGEGTRGAQAAKLFDKLLAILRTQGGDATSLVRTWLWIRDILDWYDEFNQVRSSLFRATGLIGADGTAGALPASTGVGLAPPNGACAVDAVALLDRPWGPTLMRTGNQDSAYAYGSAFSRAAWCASPAGRTLFVSGTAAIDDTGATTHVGDAASQIDDTVGNLTATLAAGDCEAGDLVACTVYCKTPAEAALWHRRPEAQAWPHIVAIGDICRNDLLFEIEARACPGARGADGGAT